MYASISYPKLRNSEFIQFFRNLLDILESNDPEVLKIKSQYDDLCALVAVLTRFYKPELGSNITSELQELDAERDDALQGIKLQIKSFTYHYDEVNRIAASILDDMLDHYGTGVERLNYQAETSTINSIIDKWDNDDLYNGALATLNLFEWLDKLKTINNKFNQRFLDRLEDQIDSPEKNTLELRAEVINSYRQLIKYLQAYTTLSTGDEYTKVNKLINELITQYNMMLAMRAHNIEPDSNDNNKPLA